MRNAFFFYQLVVKFKLKYELGSVLHKSENNHR